MNCCTLPENETRTDRSRAETKYRTPLASISETKEGYLLEAELPGVNKEGVEITVAEGELVLVGRRTPAATKGENLYRESRGWDYRRTFELDSSIDTGKIVARVENGVLSLELPKAESVKPRRIEVTA